MDKMKKKSLAIDVVIHLDYHRLVMYFPNFIQIGETNRGFPYHDVYHEIEK